MPILSNLITILLFIGATVLSFVGWPIEGDIAQAKHYYPAFYLLFIFYIINIVFKKKLFVGTYKYTTYIMITVILAFMIGRLIKGGGQIDLLIKNIVMPTLYAAYFIHQPHTNNKTIQRIVIYMYYINALLAIYERITLQNIFPLSLTYSHIDFTISTDFDANIFRSTALMGHPLTNALLTSIIMIFILTSESIKPLHKIMHYTVGLVSLFCFNARGAILISGVFLFFYILKTLTAKKTKANIKFFIIILIFLGIQGIFMLFQAGFGGRFFEHNIKEDNSILARFEVWNLLDNINIDFFLAGIPDIENYAIRILGYNHIENWFILMSLQIGIIFTIIFILLFYKLFKYYLQPYKQFDKLMLAGLTLTVSSTNNSLACGVQAIALFFVCCYAFSPYFSQKIKTSKL